MFWAFPFINLSWEWRFFWCNPNFSLLVYDFKQILQTQSIFVRKMILHNWSCQVIQGRRRQSLSLSLLGIFYQNLKCPAKAQTCRMKNLRCKCAPHFAMEHLRLSAASEKGTKKCKRKAKTVIFSWNFDLSLTFFMDWGNIYVPNGKTWGSTSSLHIGDVVFLNIWDTFGPIWTLLDHFKQELIFCTSPKPYFVHLGQKNHFCLKWPKGSRWAQKGP